MNGTYLVTWNPEQKPWPDLGQNAQQTKEGKPVIVWWNVANKRVVAGDRLFLLKQGSQLPKGILASGYATSDVRKRPHWKADQKAIGKRVSYVDAEWETIFDPATERLLQVSAIQSDALPRFHWNTQSSGIEIPPRIAERIEVLWSLHKLDVRSSSNGYSLGAADPEELEFPEGRIRYRFHRFHERDPDLPKRAKTAAIERGEPIACIVCGFDFFAKYGDVGKDFIECHHVIPVSELKHGMTTKLTDVVLVCANCHRMLHRKRPWLAIDKLKTLLTR